MALHVAVVGAGPAGLYTADELVRRAAGPVFIDVIDRLPTPYGLVRYGVAPDHPTIKSIVGTLQRVLERPEVRLIANVEIGRAITPVDLSLCYDAVVYATGAPLDRLLGVPGESLPGSYSARDLVEWYSGHPDSPTDIGAFGPRVVIVGSGNVTLDVARLLIRQPEDLRSTDVPHHVLEILLAKPVQEVHIVARRGPEHAKFTPKELRELVELPDVTVRLDPADLPESAPIDAGRNVRANLKLFRAAAETPPRESSRLVEFHFHEHPIAIEGEDRVSGLRVSRAGQAAELTGRETAVRVFPADTVIRSIGYSVGQVDGLPFDEASGTVPHLMGRVTGVSGEKMPGRYVVGWLKRGPAGVIGTNRADAVETVESLLEDVSAASFEDGPRSTIDEILRERELSAVQYPGWLNIDAAEQRYGAGFGRGRVKMHDWSDLLKAGSNADGGNS